MPCPRCGAATDSGPECPRCGVVLAKARPQRRERPLAASTGPPVALPPDPRARRSAAGETARALMLPLVLLAAVGVAAIAYVGEWSAGPQGTSPARRAQPGRGGPPAAARAAVDPPPPVAVPVAVPDVEALARATDARDAGAANALVFKLQSRALLDAEDLRTAERLHQQYPDAARDILVAVLLATAEQERAARRPDAASPLVDKALALAPDNPAARRARLAVRVEQSDWPGAESAARDVLGLSPEDAEATRTLAYALLRQDRSREAVEVLTGYLERRDDAQAAALLGRIRRDSASEGSLGQQTLAHFHVRYDGDAHEDVGREVLRVLDRHYATLSRAFDHQPTAPIPVVLLSPQRYYGEVGAPVWSGGHYTPFDGRVRIPVRGQDAELDRTILHELTHAFVADCSGGLAPRELHEGLAQMMEGHRLSEVGEEGLAALAEGRVGDPRGFYLRALGLAEDLVAQHGQGGINEVLAAMARTGSVDEAFRLVYGRDLAGLQSDWSSRLRRQHGRN